MSFIPVVILLGDYDEAELQLRHGAGCVHFRGQLKAVDQAGVILIEQSPRYRQYWSEVQRILGVRSELMIGGKRYWYLRRPNDWFSAQREAP